MQVGTYDCGLSSPFRKRHQSTFCIQCFGSGQCIDQVTPDLFFFPIHKNTFTGSKYPWILCFILETKSLSATTQPQSVLSLQPKHCFRSPRKIFTFIIKMYVYRIKVSKKKWKRNHWPQFIMQSCIQSWRRLQLKLWSMSWKMMTGTARVDHMKMRARHVNIVSRFNVSSLRFCEALEEAMSWEIQKYRMSFSWWMES